MKRKNWSWIIGILVLVVLGIGIYFWFSGGDAGSIANLGGNSIPQPPALPS